MKSEVDVVLINPATRFENYQKLGTKLAAIEPPIWTALIANAVRKEGHAVQIIDAEASGMGPDQVAQTISVLNPLLIVIVAFGHHPSASTETMPAAGAVARSLKRVLPESKTIMVGGHVAALPERTLREETVDFVCTGEGPITILELLQVLKSDRPRSYERVKSLCYLDNGRFTVTESARNLVSLNTELPGMAWDLLPMHVYRAHNWHCFGGLSREPYASLYTTLGCPYRCSFCCIHAPFKAGEQAAGYKPEINSYRFWSPEFIVREIDTLVQKYGVRNVKFADELFILNTKHVDAICDSLIERNYGLNIWAYARIDTVQERQLEKLKRAGIHWLAFGIESGSARVRQGVDKQVAQDLIFDTIAKVRNAGLHIIGNYIFGLPDDDIQSMQETLDLAMELNCDFANFYCTMAYPGSPLYQQALREGRALPKTWSGYSQYARDCQPLTTKYCTAEEVLAFRDRAFDIYFKNQRYLDFIKNKFGDQTHQDIVEMTRYKLQRDRTPDVVPASS